MGEAALKLPHIDGVLNAEELRRLTGLERDADVCKRLERQGIAVFNGRNGPWTTMDLVKAAGLRKLGITESNDDSAL